MADSNITINAPDSAKAGDYIGTSIWVDNLVPLDLYYHVLIYLNGELVEDSGIEFLSAGGRLNYPVSFEMPDSDATIEVEVYGVAPPYPGIPDYEWLDNSDSHVISLTVAPPEYAGTISKKELEYDHIKSAIPVY